MSTTSAHQPPRRLERLAAIDMPVFVANGDSDPMILPSYSHLLAELLPNARLRIYPDAPTASCSSTTPPSPVM